MNTAPDHILVLGDRSRARGPGIPDELLERVVDPFLRVSSSRDRRTDGAGSGPASARNIARAPAGALFLRDRAERVKRHGKPAPMILNGLGTGGLT